jgi:hypothetical protein
MRLNDSFWIDWVWLDGFARELGRGVIFPRWLPLSHAGLGSPVFYYYPPLAFYLGSLFVLLGFSVYASIIATFFTGYVVAGMTMYLWLRDQARAPLLGAIVYIAAPYHALDFTVRGAMAESLATAILPLVMLGLRRLSQDKGSGFRLTAISYAALIATHLPLALLASLFLFAPYALWLWRGRWTGLLPTAAALAIGIGLACICLVPALALEPYRDSARLWANPLHQPHNWSFLHRSSGDAGSFLVLLLTMVGAITFPLLVLLVWRRSIWAAWGLVCALLSVGAVPLLWDLPLLKSVQFPFRLLPVAEFALAASFAFARARPLILALLAMPFALVTAGIVTAAPGRQSFGFAELQAMHPEVPENLPPGERAYSWPSRWALEIATAHRQPRLTDGTTVEPIFYFPAWEVRCSGEAVHTFPDPETKLLSYRGRGCERAIVLTTPEKIGTAISLMALVVLFLLSAINLRSDRPKLVGRRR